MKDSELFELREQLQDLRGPAMASVHSAWADNLLKQWEQVRKDNEALRQENELIREQHQLADARIREAHDQLQHEVSLLPPLCYTGQGRSLKGHETIKKFV